MRSRPDALDLDAIDLAIVRELQNDGRITNVELARRIGMSAPPCLRRVRALEEAGVIKGYRAVVDQKTLGFEVVYFAMVLLASQAEADLAAFRARMRDWPAVRAGVGTHQPAQCPHHPHRDDARSRQGRGDCADLTAFFQGNSRRRAHWA